MATQTMSRTGTLTEQLRRDHRRLRALFDEFEDADEDRRESVAEEALSLLRTHDLIERTILYPQAFRERGIPRSLVLSCEEAHHVVRLLMAELSLRPYTGRYFAKFSKLMTGVRAHIVEEEEELFPAIERSTMDNAELGRRMRELQSRPAAMFLRRIGSRGALAAAVVAGLGWAVYSAFSRED